MLKRILKTLKFEAVRVGDSKMTRGGEYDITLKRKGFKFITKYHANIYDNVNIEDVLYCLILDSDCWESSENVHDFARSYGYEDYDKACKAYHDCKTTYMRLREIFTESEINALRAELNA